MSLNVPPVTGQTPAQVAIRMRTILKGMLMQGEAGGGLNHTWIKQRQMRALERRSQSSTYLETVDGLLHNLDLAAARRKPSEIRIIGSQITVALRQARDVLALERRASDDIVVHVQDVSTGGMNTAIVKDLYALVQALPTVEDIPVGSAENTIRAIVAICKAHFGLLQSTIESAPTAGAKEEMLKVLMQLLPSEEVEQVEPDPTPAIEEPDDEEEPGDEEGNYDGPEPVVTAGEPTNLINLNNTETV